MPVIDIERVLPDGAPADRPGLAQALADAAAGALGCAPGHAWVRLRRLPASDYAESGVGALPPSALPVFVTLQLARPPQRPALDALVRTLTEALAEGLACDAGRVHVQVAPAGEGRMAFGGRLLP